MNQMWKLKETSVLKNIQSGVLETPISFYNSFSFSLERNLQAEK